MSRAYPRLNDSATLVLLAEARRLEASERGSSASLASVVHPDAYPVATGATVASPVEIGFIRARVISALADFDLKAPLSVKDQPAFDAALGRALVGELDILPADAAHRETWNFLTGVVFPDLVFVRFDGSNEKRFLGTPRNVLRRPWSRWTVFGELLTAGTRPLGEDELVQVFERSSLVRNHRLARCLADRILTFDGLRARSDFARELAKVASHATGVRLMDVISDREMDAVVNDWVAKLTASSMDASATPKERLDIAFSGASTTGFTVPEAGARSPAKHRASSGGDS